MNSSLPFRVVICGGGVAAVEGALRLRNLLGEGAELTIVAPNKAFRYRPMAVTEAFSSGSVVEVPLAQIASDVGAELVEDTLESIDKDELVVRTGSGQIIPFDAALVAIGSRSHASYPHVRTFSDASADETLHGVIEDIEAGYIKSLAFIAPQPPMWPLPLYELALMTAARAKDQCIDDLEISLITAEPRPLAPFGRSVSDAVSLALDQAGIVVHTLAVVHVPAARRIVIEPEGPELHPDAIIALPHITGPIVSGLSHGAQGFIPIDRYCAVPNMGGRVFAAGDAVDFPVKHGGVGSQMADTAAAAIAQIAGVNVEARPFAPILRGKLLTGGDPIYIRSTVVGGHGFDSEILENPPWRSSDKIVAEELGDYLAKTHSVS